MPEAAVRRRLLPEVGSRQPEQQERRHYMSGDEKAEGLGDPPRLRRRDPLAGVLQRQVDHGVDDEQVLDLRSRYRRYRLQPFGVRLMKSRDAAQRDEREADGDGVEVTRI